MHITNPVPSLVGGAARKELVDEETNAGRAALAPLLEKLDEAGIRHHTRIDFGVVATVIVKVAHEEKVDLIVMFTDGRDGLAYMNKSHGDGAVHETFSISLSSDGGK